MNLSPLLALTKEILHYDQLLRDLSQDGKELRLTIVEAAKPYLIAALYQEKMSLPRT